MAAKTHVVIHHTAGPSGNVATITRLHKARGFKSIGYHALVLNGRGGPDGETQPGRPASQDGAGVWGNNRGKLHVAMVGQFAAGVAGYTGPPTPRQLEALGRCILQWCHTFSIPPRRVVGHREIALAGHPTACPGDLPLKRIREWTEAVLPLFVAGKPYMPLHEWLAGAGVKESLTAPRAGGITVSLTRNGLETVIPCLVKDGRTYVELRTLCEVLEWPAPAWDKATDTVKLRVR